MKKQPTYPLKEVAIKLSLTSEDDEIDYLTRQIKYWTNNDLLHTHGNKNTGTGRSRIYASDELICAAYLYELVRRKHTIKELKLFRKEFDKWIKNKENRDLLLGKSFKSHFDPKQVCTGFIAGNAIRGSKQSLDFFSLTDSQTLASHSTWSVPIKKETRYVSSMLLINCAIVIEHLDP